MRHTTRFLAITIGLGLAGGVPALRAQMSGHGEDAHATMKKAAHEGEKTGHSHEMCELHGGQVTMTKAHHFETVFGADGIRVYFYTDKQSPLMAQKAEGTATLRFQDGTSREVPLLQQKPKEGEKTAYFCPMHADVVQMEPGECGKCGGMKLFAQDYLYGKVDLGDVEPGSLKATIRIQGLSGAEPEALFTETYTGASMPMHEAHMGKAAPHGDSKETSRQGHMH
jgi:hypothetical protein